MIAPETLAPSESLTSTSVNLPFAALILRAPLVSTDFEPFLGAMVTTACDCLVSAVSDPLALLSLEPDPESEPPPPPHAVTASSSTPRINASSPLFLRPRASPDAPDIGRTFKTFSPRRAWSGPHTPAHLTCASAHINRQVLSFMSGECHHSVATSTAA